MYNNYPVKRSIAGTVESISKIDTDVLYKCYNTFYNPSNMVMMLCGNFEPESLLEDVKKRLKNKKMQGSIQRIYKDEPESIVKKEKIQKMEVSMPIFVIGIKDKVLNDLSPEEQVKRHIAIDILLNMALGKSSKLYKELYEEDLLTSEKDALWPSLQELKNTNLFQNLEK